jgi:hypothetical protein
MFYCMFNNTPEALLDKMHLSYWNNISIPEIAFAKLEGNNSL